MRANELASKRMRKQVSNRVSKRVSKQVSKRVVSSCLGHGQLLEQHGILHLQPYLGAMQLGEVGPAGHGVELRLRLDQIYDSFASIAWQRGSTLIQQLDMSSCITLPASASL